MTPFTERLDNELLAKQTDSVPAPVLFFSGFHNHLAIVVSKIRLIICTVMFCESMPSVFHARSDINDGS